MKGLEMFFFITGLTSFVAFAAVGLKTLLVLNIWAWRQGEIVGGAITTATCLLLTVVCFRGHDHFENCNKE